MTHLYESRSSAPSFVQQRVLPVLPEALDGLRVRVDDGGHRLAAPQHLAYPASAQQGVQGGCGPPLELRLAAELEQQRDPQLVGSRRARIAHAHPQPLALDVLVL